jgi:hypothetical protein
VSGPFIGTYSCALCARRVRVYDWLPECVLCARCKRRVEIDEELSAQRAPSDEGDSGLPVYDAATGEELDGTASHGLARLSAAGTVPGPVCPEPGDVLAYCDGGVWRAAGEGHPGARLVWVQQEEVE